MCILSRINLSSPRILPTTRYSRWSGNARFLDSSGKSLGAYLGIIICKALPPHSGDLMLNKQWIKGYKEGLKSNLSYVRSLVRNITKARIAYHAGFKAGIAVTVKRRAKLQAPS
jgi:hypothetical protein